MLLLVLLCIVIDSIPQIYPFNLTADFEYIKSNHECGKACYFQHIEITSHTINDWPTQSKKVCGLIALTENSDVSFTDLKEKFKNMTKLNGGIRIINTKMNNITFLPSFDYNCESVGTVIVNNSLLEDITSFLKIRVKIGAYKTCSLDVSRNANLDTSELCHTKSFERYDSKRVFGNMVDCGELDMYNSGYFYPANLQDLHPDFCLTIDEILFVIEHDVRFRNIDARYCEYKKPKDAFFKLCVFEKMSSLEDNCRHILGDLVIESGDEDYVKKLKGVSHVFGSVTIRNTDLKNCKFFAKLETIASLNESLPVMQFIGNKDLKYIDFPYLSKCISRSKLPIYFSDNHPEILEFRKSCVMLQYFTGIKVSYNGKDCKSITSTEKEEEYKIDYEDPFGTYLYDSDSEEYEGTYIDFLDGSESRALFDIVNKVNYGFGGIGFITNFIHFLILFSKDLRGNFIYILMIGICICDMFMLGTFCLDFVFFWVYDDEYDKSCMESVNYYHIHVRAVGEYVKETTRRSSLVLAFLMAFFRTISVMFPLSTVISTLMKPTFAVLMVIICIAICTISDALKYSRAEIWDAACPNQYFLTWNTRDNTFIDTEQLIDAIFTIGIVFLYICVTIALVVQLKIAHQRRKNLKTDKSENTSKLVFVMTITYLIAEVFFALLSFLEVNDFLGSVIVWLLHTYAQHIKWSVMAVNSTVHCFICLLMSSQYRNNARQMFWREKQKGSPPIMELATVSTVRKGKTSGSRTY